MALAAPGGRTPGISGTSAPGKDVKIEKRM